MKHVMVVPVGENNNALFVGLKEFQSEKVILVATNERKAQAQQLKMDLDKVKIETEIHAGSSLEEMFHVVNQIKKDHPENEVVMNLGAADKGHNSFALTAAFLNGVRAFEVMDEKCISLPLMKTHYSAALNDKKMNMLKLIAEHRVISLENLSKLTKMSLPLLSYHLNGTYKVEGLKELGLVETVFKKGKLEIELTSLGKLMITGK